MARGIRTLGLLAYVYIIKISYFIQIGNVSGQCKCPSCLDSDCGFGLSTLMACTPPSLAPPALVPRVCPLCTICISLTFIWLFPYFLFFFFSIFFCFTCDSLSLHSKLNLKPKSNNRQPRLPVPCATFDPLI